MQAFRQLGPEVYTLGKEERQRGDIAELDPVMVSEFLRDVELFAEISP